MNDSNGKTRIAAPDFFLSYNHVDRDAVLVVQQELEKRGVSTCLDSENFRLGLPWLVTLSNTIQEVRAVIIFIGKAGLGSWQIRELSLSLNRQVQEEKLFKQFPVIPVLLPGADVKEASSFLLLNSWIDLRGGLKTAAALNALARAVGEVGQLRSLLK
jgi:hypothetical protein